MALPAPGPPAQLGLDVPYRSPAIFVPTASNLGAAIICPNSSTASLVQPQRPPASSTQLLYRRRIPPYLLQRHTPLLLRPAPASLAPLPLRRRSRDRLPSSGMWPCQRQDRLLSWASMCRTDRLQSSSRRPATSALQSSAPIAVPCLYSAAAASACVLDAAAVSACVLDAGGALPIYCSCTRRSCCDQHLRPSRRYRCAAGAATACPLAACGPASARTACSVGPRCAVPIACNLRPDGQQPRRCNHLPQ